MVSDRDLYSVRGVERGASDAEINRAFYGEATPPMFAVVDVPPLASIFSVLVVPLLTELAEPVVVAVLVGEE